MIFAKFVAHLLIGILNIVIVENTTFYEHLCTLNGVTVYLNLNLKHKTFKKFSLFLKTLLYNVLFST